MAEKEIKTKTNKSAKLIKITLIIRPSRYHYHWTYFRESLLTTRTHHERIESIN